MNPQMQMVLTALAAQGASTFVMNRVMSPNSVELEAAERLKELAEELPEDSGFVVRDGEVVPRESVASRSRGSSVLRDDEAGEVDLGVAREALETYREVTEQAFDVESCGTCRELLRLIRKEPVEVQLAALPELEELKKAMESGAGDEELGELWRELETLRDVWNRRS